MASDLYQKSHGQQGQGSGHPSVPGHCGAAPTILVVCYALTGVGADPEKLMKGLEERSGEEHLT